MINSDFLFEINLIYKTTDICSIFKGTYKVRKEIETKRNETKSTKTKRNETKRNEINKNETKRNEINEMKTK